jgi:hypothetical protein
MIIAAENGRESSPIGRSIGRSIEFEINRKDGQNVDGVVVSDGGSKELRENGGRSDSANSMNDSIQVQQIECHPTLD